MSDAVLARRLSKLQTLLEVAKAPTVERHLDRLLGLVVEAGVWRETARP